MIQKIGIIGLGLMGSAISENLLNEEYPVIGFDILPEKTNALKSKNGTPAHSCVEVAKISDVVITSLPSESSLKRL